MVGQALFLDLVWIFCRSFRRYIKVGFLIKIRRFLTMMMPGAFKADDPVIVCYGAHCGFQGVITRILYCFLWVQGAGGFVVNVHKCSVALIVEGASDSESNISVDPLMPNVIPDYDSDVTE
jgi:hypothetical protein